MKSVNGVGGWLLLLCLILLVWQPLTLGLVASRALDSLAIGGWPLALALLTRVFVAGFGIAAGLALIRRRPGAVTLAKVSVALSAAADVLVYMTPFLPSNRLPGTTPVYVTASLAYAGIWLLYLFRSKRVRDTCL